MSIQRTAPAVPGLLGPVANAPRPWYARMMVGRAGMLYVLPAAVLLALVTLIPFVYLLYNSLQRWNLQRAYLGQSFIGLTNYLTMFQDPLFWQAMQVTVILAIGIVVSQVVLGILLALLFSREVPGKRVLRSLFLLPMITTPVVVGLTWRMLYNADLGMINYALGLVGLPQPIWLASPGWAVTSVVLTDTWQAVPFVTLMFVAGLQALPVEPREAAYVDGANGWRIFRDITLPQLKPIIFLALLFRVTDAIRMFDLIYVLTSGGPANATQTLNMYAFKVGFTFLDIGYGSALAVALMAICIGVSWLLVRYSGLEVGGVR